MDNEKRAPRATSPETFHNPQLSPAENEQVRAAIREIESADPRRKATPPADTAGDE